MDRSPRDRSLRDRSLKVRRSRWPERCALALVLLAAIPLAADAQRGGRGRGGRGRGGGSAEAAAAIDLTGYWVSVVTEDWKMRMVTPPRGVYDSLTLNNQGRMVGDAWDPDRDEAMGEACRGYGAPAIMRLPGRFHVTWEDANTLRIDTDYGTQTRLFHFLSAPDPEEPAWQGHSVAEWQNAARGGGGSLKVVTTNLRLGYIRRNGAPYSDQTVLTEYFNVNTLPNGDQYLTVTTSVDDPVYFNRALLTTTDFKKLPDDTGWDPTPCSAHPR